MHKVCASLLSSLSKRELSWPISREAMTEGSRVGLELSSSCAQRCRCATIGSDPTTAARSPFARLAAMPLAGLLTRRPANGAAAEIPSRLFLPLATAGRNPLRKGRLCFGPLSEGAVAKRLGASVETPATAKAVPLPLPPQAAEGGTWLPLWGSCQRRRAAATERAYRPQSFSQSLASA